MDPSAGFAHLELCTMVDILRDGSRWAVVYLRYGFACRRAAGTARHFVGFPCRRGWRGVLIICFCAFLWAWGFGFILCLGYNLLPNVGDCGTGGVWKADVSENADGRIVYRMPRSLRFAQDYEMWISC